MTTQDVPRPDLFRDRIRAFAEKVGLRLGLNGPEKAAVPSVAEIAGEYLTCCRVKVKASTYSAYETTVRKHIIPEFGAVPVTELDAESVNRFLRAKTYSPDGAALAASTVRGIVTAMRGLLRYAGSAGWPVASFEWIHCPARSGAEARTLSAAEQQRLKEYCRSDMDPVKLGVLISLFTGLRIGELCAMKWGDISFETGVITVRRTIQRIRDPDHTGKQGERKTRVIFDAPKSKSANRCIPIPAFLLEYLKSFRRQKDDFLLTGRAGVWMEPRTLQNKFGKLLSGAGIAHINFHALRHTFATNCVEQGFDVKTLSRILGHSDVGVTLNTYVHPSVSVMRSYMNRLV